MLIALNGDSDTLLDYALDTQPAPLTASPAKGTAVLGALTIVASNGGTTPIWLEKLEISFGISSIAQALASDGANISVSVTPSDTWSACVTSRSSTFIAEITPVAGGSQEITSDGFVVQIYGIPINTAAGVAPVTLDEWSSNDGTHSSQKTGTLEVGKFPYGFFVNNFVASAPQVANGNPVELSWNGAENGTYYLSFGSHAPVNVTNQRTFTSPPLNQDTVFMLHASTVEHSQSVNFYLSATVTVSMPNLEATSLTVAQTAEVDGAVKMGDTLCVKGDVSATGNANVSGTFGVDGKTTLEEAAVKGTLDVTGDTKLSSLNVTGTSELAALKVSGTSSLGTLSVSGSVQMLGNSVQLLTPGTYKANTDGCVVGYLQPRGPLPCVAWMYFVFGEDHQIAMGAGYVDVPSVGVLPYSNSAMMPFQNGQTWSVVLEVPPNTTFPYTSIYFFPIGQGSTSSAAEFVERIGDAPEVSEGRATEGVPSDFADESGSAGRLRPTPKD